jgi:predicted CoA-binding protein
MISNKPVNAKEILGTARNILLIDWPHADVPRTLLEEGFTVFCYSPGRYTRAEIENGHLVFRELDSIPGPVDIVNVYRPEQEHADIISNHVLPLGAKVLWLHPPITSEKTCSLAVEHGLTFVEGISITEVKRK